jgi:HEAT repeat protein
MLPRAGLLASLAVVFLACPGRADYDPMIDSHMYHNPELPTVSIVLQMPPRAPDLWLQALARPEMEFRYQAAQAISLAHRRGFKGFEKTIEPLRTALNRTDEQPLVRLAIARALVDLDARATAPDLWRQAQAGNSDLRGVVEPALASWDFQPARAVWLQRLRDPATPADALRLAIVGLATVREHLAAEALRDIVLEKQAREPARESAEGSQPLSYRPYPPSVRLEAARALALLRPSRLEKDAERLAADTSFDALLSRLAAAELLHQHGSPEAIHLLERLELDPEPAVARLAVARLDEIDSKLVVPALGHLLASPDANLRSLACKVLFQQPSPEHLHLLAVHLNDAHQGVRREARDWLRKLAEKRQWHDKVIAEASQVLAGNDWRGLEQAAILLVLLDHRPAAERLFQLLDSGRAEVVITAAWGLRRLAVPETFPKVLAYIVKQKQLFKQGKGMANRPKDFAGEIFDHLFSQLNQLLGEQRYRPADSMLRQYVPRGTGGMETRASAIYALGLIHQGKADAALVAALEARLADVSSRPPEDSRVRRMSAISLSRMMGGSAGSQKSQDPQLAEHVKILQRFCPEQMVGFEMVSTACGWAVERITGEPMKARPRVERMERDWFLSPLD